MRFKVIKGIFIGHEFEGKHHLYNQNTPNAEVRIIDTETDGRSYPASICMAACKHKWAASTKNYKRIRRCTECGEIKEVKPKTIKI